MDYIDCLEILRESGVVNEFTHWEDGKWHTVIASKEEVDKLVTLAFELGYEQRIKDAG